MIVEQIWTANAYRNFNYLIACPETGEALAVDPLDHQQCLAIAKDKGWQITQVLNTHEHGDHTGGNKQVIAATGAKLLAHANAKDSIPGIDWGLGAGDVIRVGKTVELESLDTPGHTMSHVCLFWRNGTGGKFFSGDTLFNAGAGNCHHGGHPDSLYNTFSKVLSRLGDAVELYPGHDYLERNLAFTLDREPGNLEARRLLDRQGKEAPPEVLSMGEERQINVFLRLDCEEIRSRLSTASGQVPQDDQACFLALRSLRNRW